MSQKLNDELTPAEIEAATGKKRPAAQAAELAKRGIAYGFTGHPQLLRQSHTPATTSSTRPPGAVATATATKPTATNSPAQFTAHPPVRGEPRP